MGDIFNLLNIVSENELNNLSNSSYTYNGHKVPRVTSIISRCIHSDGLMYWANNLGLKQHQSYSKFMKEAAGVGTMCHDNIDAFHENMAHEVPENIDYRSLNAYNSFLLWFNDINNLAAIEIVFHEKPLVCPWFGGTLDALYKINGAYYLIDFKTSNHVTFNYFLQLAAYRYILKTEYDINVDGVIVLQLNKNSISYNEYTLNFSHPEHFKFIEMCERTFLSLVYSYYNISIVEDEYNKLKLGG